MNISSATEYANAIRIAFENDALIQCHWRVEQSGRQLTCALGIIGDDVDSHKKCPAQIMPRWLARMVQIFFDCQDEEDAFDWVVRFSSAIARIDGKVPFNVVHDWRANTMCQLAIRVAEKLGHDPAPHVVLQDFHHRTSCGEKITIDDWVPALFNVYSPICRDDRRARLRAIADSEIYTSDTIDDAYSYINGNPCQNFHINGTSQGNFYGCAGIDFNDWKYLADGMVDAINRSEGLT